MKIKSLILSSSFLFSSLLFCEECFINEDVCCDTETRSFDFAVSSGYTWKTDKHFRRVYGKGIPNWVTADACYWFYKPIGLGVKSSYWEKKGKTTVFEQHTRLTEVPLILYLKGVIGNELQGYLAVGGGVIFAKEKSYLGKVSKTVPGGDIEVGVNYSINKYFYLTGAFDYLFFYKKISGFHGVRDFGGYGFRLGLGTGF